MDRQPERPDYSIYPIMTLDEVHRSYPDAFVQMVDIEVDDKTLKVLRGRVKAVAKSRKQLPPGVLYGRCTTVFTGERDFSGLPTLLWRLGVGSASPTSSAPPSQVALHPTSAPLMTMAEIFRKYPDSFVQLVDIEIDPVTRQTLRGRVRAVAGSRKDLPRDGLRGYFTTVFTGEWEVREFATLD